MRELTRRPGPFATAYFDASYDAFVPIGGGRPGRVGRPIADGVGATLRFPLPRRS